MHGEGEKLALAIQGLANLQGLHIETRFLRGNHPGSASPLQGFLDVVFNVENDGPRLPTALRSLALVSFEPSWR